MAKIISTEIVIKLSKIIKDSDDGHDTTILTTGQLETIEDSLPELIESIVSDPSMIVEMTSK